MPKINQSERAAQYSRVELAQKRFKAAVWMRRHSIERVDRMCNVQAALEAATDWVRELRLLMEMDSRA